MNFSEKVLKPSFLQGLVLLIGFGRVASGAPLDVRVTIGADGKEHRFVRDTTFLQLGVAFRDERGLIWGDVVKKADGTFAQSGWLQAKEYCLSLNPEAERARIKEEVEAGAEPETGIFLPLKQNFVALARDLGSKSVETGEGYRVQASISNLENWSWSASPYAFDFAYGFDGRDGKVFYDFVANQHYYSIRCVAR